MHVDCRTGVSGAERLLSNASAVGRAAGVADLPAVPRHLGRCHPRDGVDVTWAVAEPVDVPARNGSSSAPT